MFPYVHIAAPDSQDLLLMLIQTIVQRKSCCKYAGYYTVPGELFSSPFFLLLVIEFFCIFLVLRVFLTISTSKVIFSVFKIKPFQDYHHVIKCF